MPTTVLTQATLEVLKAAFAAGASRTEAAERAGVSRRALFNWLARGEQGQSGLYRELTASAKIAPLELRRIRRAAARRRWKRR